MQVISQIPQVGPTFNQSYPLHSQNQTVPTHPNSPTRSQPSRPSVTWTFLNYTQSKLPSVPPGNRLTSFPTHHTQTPRNSQSSRGFPVAHFPQIQKNIFVFVFSYFVIFGGCEIQSFKKKISKTKQKMSIWSQFRTEKTNSPPNTPNPRERKEESSF